MYNIPNFGVPKLVSQESCGDLAAGDLIERLVPSLGELAVAALSRLEETLACWDPVSSLTEDAEEL